MHRATTDTTFQRSECSISAAAYPLVADRLRMVTHWLRRVRRAPDREEVHQLRVAVRRAEAVLNLFANWLPKGRRQTLAKQLAGIRRHTAPARDLDVLAQTWLQARAALSNLPMRRWQAEWKRQRRQANADLRQLAKRRTRQQVGQSNRRILAGFRWRGSHAEPEMTQLVRLRLAQIRGIPASESTLPTRPKELHCLRIECRQWRYELEVLAKCDPRQASALETLLAALRAVQDHLGAAQDRYVQAKRLKDWLKRNPLPKRERHATRKYLSELQRADRSDPRRQTVGTLTHVRLIAQRLVRQLAR